MSMTATETATRAAPQASVTRLVRPGNARPHWSCWACCSSPGAPWRRCCSPGPGSTASAVVVAARDLQPGEVDLSRRSAGHAGVNGHRCQLRGRRASGRACRPIRAGLRAGRHPAESSDDRGGRRARPRRGRGRRRAAGRGDPGRRPAPGRHRGGAGGRQSADTDWLEAPPADLGAAAVYEVAPASSDPTDGTWVSLRQPGPLGLKIAQAAADGTLRLAFGRRPRVSAHQLRVGP